MVKFKIRVAYYLFSLYNSCPYRLSKKYVNAKHAMLMLAMLKDILM